MSTPMRESSGNNEAGDVCPHFGECGGCQSQDVPYAEQTAAKARLLEELFAPFTGDPIPVTPSPVTRHYRNKVDPSFAGKHYDTPPPADFERETVLGFKKRWYWPIEIETCRIGPEGLDALLGAVRVWYRAAGLRAYDSRRGTGFLRHLLVRDAKRTDDKMVVLITHEGDFDEEAFVKAVLDVYPATSIQHGVNRGRADVAIAEELRVLDGAAEITERLEIPDEDGVRPLEFRISPFSFFQTNSTGTELLYGAIRRWLRGTGASRLYDLYGGGGGIAFTCADLVEEVCSVEIATSASSDGQRNAALNGISNVSFVTEKVKNYLLALREGAGMPPGSAVVIDPARSGMHPKARQRLCQLAPEHLLYVSCNPKILAQELPEFLEEYALAGLEAFDLFPHTRHVEVLATLTRRG